MFSRNALSLDEAYSSPNILLSPFMEALPSRKFIVTPGKLIFFV